MTKKLLIIANNNIGTSQSGGDTIFLELSKHWQKKIPITILGSAETKYLLKRFQLKNIKFYQTDNLNIHSYPSVFNLLKHTIRRLILGIFHLLKDLNLNSYTHCYTSSDFYPDFLLGLIYKIIKPQGIWICGYYLIATRPNNPDCPYKNEKLKGWLYYISQTPTKYLANKFADIIFITSKPEAEYFPHKKIVIIHGGVDLSHSQKQTKYKKKYDGIFIGRLHPQKGVLELVDIWKILTQKLPQANLAIIGDGILNQAIKEKIRRLNLLKNIKMFGFQIGQKKYKLIQQSKIIVHPATYDSGGMAAADAMAFGLPGVSFDLPALKTYYPQGVIKTPLNQKHIFADNIYKLLTNKKFYSQTSFQAKKLIYKHWNWQNQAKHIYQQTFHESK